ncbi:uncharacterized protein [Scyliorhinus torazame]|uniref:uncharacterized protein isoform X2 n=1 Tax=Scyliorhinus torazame TaxID=75743 RepID=UPI003B5ABD20
MVTTAFNTSASTGTSETTATSPSTSTSTEPSTMVTTALNTSASTSTNETTVMQNMTTSGAATRSTAFSQQFSTPSSTIETSTIGSTIVMTTHSLPTSATTRITNASCPEFTKQDLGNITTENVGNRNFTLRWIDQTFESCGCYIIERSPEDGSYFCTFNFSRITCSFIDLLPGQTYTLNIHFIDNVNRILTRTLNVTTDSDECGNGDNQCEQICIDRNKFEDVRGYECSCRTGFELDSDRKSCRAPRKVVLRFTVTSEDLNFADQQIREKVLQRLRILTKNYTQ